MTIYVFGNPDLPVDALPIRLVPDLRRRFPEHNFELPDPNEEWQVPEHLVVIDTVVGIALPRVFTGLEVFSRTPRVTIHDYDALTQLQLLQKLGRVREVTVIGVPPEMDDQRALTAVTDLLRGFDEHGIISGNAIR